MPQPKKIAAKRKGGRGGGRRCRESGRGGVHVLTGSVFNDDKEVTTIHFINPTLHLFFGILQLLAMSKPSLTPRSATTPAHDTRYLELME